MAGGRLTTYTTELAERICYEVATGRSLRSVCQELDVPHPTVLSWVIYDHDGFADRYAKSRQLQWAAWGDKIVDEATNCRIGEKVKTLPDGSTEITEGDCVDRSRLAVDALKWTLAKLHPKQYGDKVEQTQIHEIGDTLKAEIARVRAKGP